MNKKSSSWLQCKLLCTKRFQICYRNFSLIKLILFPVLVVLINYVVNVTFDRIIYQGNIEVEVYPPVTTIPDYCSKIGDSETPCYNLLYIPANVSWVENMMKKLAAASNLDFATFKGFNWKEDDFQYHETVSQIMANTQTYQGIVAFHTGHVYGTSKPKDYILNPQEPVQRQPGPSDSNTASRAGASFDLPEGWARFSSLKQEASEPSNTAKFNRLDPPGSAIPPSRTSSTEYDVLLDETDSIEYDVTPDDMDSTEYDVPPDETDSTEYDFTPDEMDWIEHDDETDSTEQPLDTQKVIKIPYRDIWSFDGKITPPNVWYEIYYHNNVSDIPFVQAVVYSVENYSFYQYFIDNDIDPSGIQYNIKHTGYPSPVSSFAISGFSQIASAILYSLVSMFIFSNVLSGLTWEKHVLLRKSLHQAGLTRTAYFVSWIVYIFVVSILSALVMCAAGTALPLDEFRKSNFLTMVIVYATLSISTGCFALFVSTFVRRPSTSLTVIYAFTMLSTLLQSALTLNEGFMVQTIYTSPSVATAFFRIFINAIPFGVCALIYDSILFFTTSSSRRGVKPDTIGMNFSSFTYTNEKLPPYYPLFLYVYLSLWLIALVSLVLFWYFDTILFDSGGKRPPFYFFLTPSYWGVRRKRRSAPTDTPVFEAQAPDSRDSTDPRVKAERQRAVEAARSGAEKDIAINAIDVIKVYKPWYARSSRSEFTAVDHLSLSIGKGEFFTILGHNGAGKTTLFSVLSCQSSMTAGYVSYFGHDLRENQQMVRDMIGCCLQYDVFWPELTALEHLDLFHQVRGVSEKGELRDRGMELLRQLDLEEVANQRADSFSGGMKRRLSFAISCTGDPQILFLDEPSSGLDPENYKRLWRALQSLKGRVTIVLVTHNMMEAELLSDRVGVMVNGRFEAIGTVLGLKSEFGYGYQVAACLKEGTGKVVVEKYREEHPYLEVRERSEDGTRLEMDVKKSDIERVPELLSQLEEDKNVRAWGVSQSSLESVFMSIADKCKLDRVYDKSSKRSKKNGEARELQELGAPQKKLSKFDTEIGKDEVPVGKKMKSYPLSALFSMSWKLQLRRSRYSTIFSVLSPVVILAMFLLVQSYLRSEYPDSYDGKKPFSAMSRISFQWFSSPLTGQCSVNHDFRHYVACDRGVSPQLLGFSRSGKYFKDNRWTGFYTSMDEIWCTSESTTSLKEYPVPELTNKSDEQLLREVLLNTQARSRLASAQMFSGEFVNLSSVAEHYRIARFHELSVDARDAHSPMAKMNITLRTNDYFDSHNDLLNRYIRHDALLVSHYIDNVTSDHFHILNAALRMQDFTIHLRLYRVFVSKALDPTHTYSVVKSPINFLDSGLVPDTNPIEKMIATIFSMSVFPYAFSIFIPLALYGLVRDNCDRTKKMMRIHGLSPTYYYLNAVAMWGALYAASVLLFVAFAISANIYFVVYAVSAHLLILLGWGLSLLSFVFFISTFIRSTAVAGAVGIGICFLVTTIVDSVVVGIYEPMKVHRRPLPFWLYFWPQTGFFRCLDIIDYYGRHSFGEAWSLSTAPAEFVRSIVSLYLCALFYAVLFSVSLALFTGEFSYPHHLALRLWRRVTTAPRLLARRLRLSLNLPTARPPPPADASPNSPVHLGLQDVENEKALVSQYAHDRRSADDPLRDCPLVVQGLSKKYPGGKVAVKEFYLHAPLSTCFGLLGENGAGKSTLLSMLTGTIPVTSGTAYICGFDTSSQLSKALKCIGYCPQQDVLWGELTVQEHLEFYARLGGVHPLKSRKYVKKFLWDVGLYHFRHRRSSKLSGGMKRRLSLSIAICANSYVIFLDEPSCGLDVMNRRQLWNIVQHNKRGRTTLITTHSMDEADALCDKIGIMAQGSLWCYGDPQYIKDLYNRGCHVRVVFSNQQDGANFIKRRIPSSILKSKFSNITEYYVPPSQPVSLVFRIMLEACGQPSSGIEDWGLSQPGLECALEQIIAYVRGRSDHVAGPEV